MALFASLQIGPLFHLLNQHISFLAETTIWPPEDQYWGWRGCIAILDEDRLFVTGITTESKNEPGRETWIYTRSSNEWASRSGYSGSSMDTPRLHMICGVTRDDSVIIQMTIFA